MQISLWPEKSLHPNLIYLIKFSNLRSLKIAILVNGIALKQTVKPKFKFILYVAFVSLDWLTEARR